MLRLLNLRLTNDTLGIIVDLGDMLSVLPFFFPWPVLEACDDFGSFAVAWSSIESGRVGLATDIMSRFDFAVVRGHN